MGFHRKKADLSGTNSEKLPYKNSHLIFLFAYVILICRTMVACYRITDFNYLHVSLLFLLGILLYKLYSIIISKASLKTASFVLVLSVLLLFILNLHSLRSLWDTNIVQNFNSINKGIYYGSETYFNQFLPFLIVLIPITSAACYAFSRNGAAELSILIISLYLFSFWNNGLDKLLARYVPGYILLSLSYYSIIKYDKMVSKFKSTNTKVTVSFKNILIYTLFLTLSITLASAGATHLFGTKSIIQLKNDYATKETSLAYLSKESAFDLTDTGYGSDSGKLGGPVQINNLVSLKVKADRPVYLRGAVKDYYDGHSWSKSSDAYILKGMEPLLIPDKDYNFIMTGDINRKPDIEKMSIYNYGLATSTLFSPNNTLSVNIKSGKVMYDSSRTFTLVGNPTVNETFTLKYYFSNTGVEYFDKIKGTSHGISYETDNTESTKIDYYRNNVLLPNRAYLQIPQSITSRTYELVDAITIDCKSTEDKISKIMNYLSTSFPYSLEVSQVPEDIDFIDHFLFNEKKGYCTYFATTATIMCRIAGIPARYVEGFNMNEEKDSDGLYIVRNHRAHAWTEILVSPESNLWCIVDCVPQGASINEISNSSQYRDRFSDDRYKSSDSRFVNLELGEYNNDNMKDYTALLSILIYPLFIIPAIIFIFLFLYILYRLIRFNRAVAKLLKAESTIPLYKHLTSRLRSIGEGFPEECCELEHVRSLKDKELSKCLEKMVIACYSEYYGSIDNYPAIDKKACNRIIESYMWKKQGFLKYWYCRIRYFHVKRRYCNLT